MTHVPCCAATYDSDRGTGRHLAACLAEDPQELPQVVMTRILKKASRFSGVPRDDRVRQVWGLWRCRDCEHLFHIFPEPGDERCRTYHGYDRVPNDDRDWARLPQQLLVPYNEGCKTHRWIDLVAKQQGSKDDWKYLRVWTKSREVTVPVYLNYSQFLKKDDDRSTAECVTNEELVVTVPTYFNFSLCQTREDEEPNVCYYKPSFTGREKRS